jgi:hypothetical protein
MSVCRTTTIALLLAASCASAGEVRVLCDFEKEAVAKWVEFREQDGKSYTARSGGCYGCNFSADKGPATSGEWALSRKYPARGACRYMPGVRDGDHLIARKLFTTSYSLAKIAPTDWTGFDSLELNVRKDKPGTVGLAVALEDRAVSPPVIRRFTLLEENRWHTLRVPIEPLGEVLNLKDMVNFWVIVEASPADVELRVDDVRLVKGDGGGKLPVLTDSSPVEETYEKLAAELVAVIPSEARHNVNTLEGEVQPPPPEPGRDSREFTRPAEVEEFGLLELSRAEMKSFTRRVFPHGLEVGGDKSAIIITHPSRFAYTTDAGKTWKKRSSCFRGTNSWRSEISGDRGDLLFVGLGTCCGGGLPTTFYFRRLVAGGDGWKLGPAYPVDRDTRHCEDHYDVLRLDSGRIWAAWNHCQRFGGYGLHAKYSDDDGRTWKAPEAGPALPGSVGKCGLGTDPKLFPLGEGVGCLWQDNSRGVHFNRHDGKSWSAAADLKTRGPVSAASADGKGACAVVGGGRNGPVRVLGLDGDTWTEDLKPAGLGHLTARRESGRLHYVYTENREGGKSRVMMISRDGGKWGTPREVFKPGQKHAGYQTVIVSVPRWSPEEFVPAAVVGLRGTKNWKDVVWIQVLKVPVAGT